METRITYEIKGASRREPSKAISEVLNTKAVYKGVPSCAYEIGGIFLDREGSVILSNTMTEKETSDLVTSLKERGFKATNYGEDAFDGYEVSMPRELFTDKALENLRKIVNAKGELIGRAIGTQVLRIIESDEKVSFP